MIKTTTTDVYPNRKAEEGNVEGVVYSRVERVSNSGAQIIKLKMTQIVIDEIKNNYTNEEGEEVTDIRHVERVIAEAHRYRTHEQIAQLVALLRSPETLQAIGLGGLAGVYDSLSFLEQEDFMLKVGHLIGNNEEQLRGKKWTLSV